MGRVNLIVAALLMLSAISLVTSRYQSRQLFVELGRDQAQARDLETNWGACSWNVPNLRVMRGSM